MRPFKIRMKSFTGMLAIFLMIHQTMSGTAVFAQTEPIGAETQTQVPTTSPDESTAQNQNTTTEQQTSTDALADDNPLSAPTVELQQSANVTTFPGRPVITTFDNLAVISVDQKSSSEFRLNYDLSQEGSFGGAIINFGATPQGPQNLSSFTDFQFEFATNNTCPAGTPCLKVEFVDVNNQLGSFLVEGVGSTFTPVTISKAAIQQSNPAVDFTSIKQINFVVDQGLTSNDVGFFDIRAGGLAFTPIVNGAAVTATPTQFPGEPPLTTFSNESTVTLEETSETAFRINYDIATPGGFGGGIINYGETTAGFQDLSGFPELVFNLATNNACSNGKCLKIEFVDADNEISVVQVNNLSVTPSQVTIDQDLILEANGNIDLTRVKQINFVIEGANTSPAAGFLEVTTGGFGGTTPPPGPGPDPGPGPGPGPGPQPGGAVFTGITEGSTVSGTVTVQPDLTQNPDIHKVFYYLNGTKAGRSYEAPFIWGGTGGMDTSQLPDGEYELTALYTTPEGDQTFTVRFTVNNGNTAPAADEPAAGEAASFTGLSANESVSGTVTVQPNLTALPNIHKVFYYVDGTRIDRVYESPFALTLDTSTLEDGPHTLVIAYATTDADFMNSGEFVVEIPFTVGTGTAASTDTTVETGSLTDTDLTGTPDNTVLDPALNPPVTTV